MSPYDNDNQMRPTFGAQDFGRQQVGVAASNAFLSQVFSWMFAGLLITGLVGWYVADSGLGQALRGAFLFVIIAQLGLVFYLSARIQSMAPGTATTLFLVYSGLMGITLSVIFVKFPASVLLSTFIITGGLFAVLALFGATTKMDLRRIGTIGLAALIVLIIAMVVNMFVASAALNMGIAVVGVVLFAGLTAWDMQNLSQYGAQVYGRDAAMDSRMAIFGALSLYLNFVNMFLFILRLVGSRD